MQSIMNSIKNSIKSAENAASAVCRPLIKIAASLVISVVSSTCVPFTVAAQNLFSFPRGTPDVTQYLKIDECLSATDRVLRMATDFNIRRDTFPTGVLDTVNSLPATVVSTAQQCSKKITVTELFQHEKIGIGTAEHITRLLLMASRDPDVKEFIYRWLASISTDNDTTRAAGLHRFAAQHLGARPARFSSAWELVDSMNKVKFWSSPISVVATVLAEADRLQDTVNAYRAAKWLSIAPEMISDSIKQTTAWKLGAAFSVYRGLVYLNRTKILDSLKMSSDAYRRFNNDLLDKAGVAEDRRLSEKVAEPVVGEFWFPNAPAQPRPTHGKIGLVLMLKAQNCMRCLPAVAMLQRFHQRFPNVEITLIAKTFGFLGLTREPMAPNDEAVVLDSIYLQLHHLPATLVVQKTAFWRLPEPDFRRINELGPNDELYGGSLDDRNPTAAWIASLIDRNGKVVISKLGWMIANEKEITEYAEALLKQPQ